MKNVIITSIYIKNYPIHTASVNEPNKNQITELVRNAATKIKLDGTVSYQEYHDLGNGDKGYSFLVGETKVGVIVRRLPILKFGKGENENTLTEI